MRIGIDLRVLSTSRALSRYAKNIVDQLLRISTEHKLFLLTDSVDSLQKINAIRAGIGHLSFESVIAPKKLVIRDHFFFWDSIRRLDLDIFFHPDNTEFLKCHPNSIVTLHDLLPYILPEAVLSGNPLIRVKQEMYFRLQLKALKDSCHRIITVSENTRKDIIRILGVPENRVQVIYEGIEEKFTLQNNQDLIASVKNKYKINGVYLLYLGGFEIYKNVERLIKAFGQSFTHNLKLVLAGESNSGSAGLKKLVRDLGMEESVIFPGFIEEADLPAIYGGATLFVYPSLYEGFGFPPLEALACGTPVVISNTSSLPEVGGDAAFYFNPESVNSIAGALEQALRLNLSNRVSFDRISDAGRILAKRFDWRVAAEKTLALFEEVLHENKNI